MSFNYSPRIVTSGLVMCLDAANPRSYSGTGSVWTDISRSQFRCSLINNPSFSTNNNGIIILDGTDDYALITSADIKNYTTITATLWMNIITYISNFETYFGYNSEEGGLSQGWGVRRTGGNDFQYWGGSGNTGIKLYINGTLASSSGSTFDYGFGRISPGNWQMVTLVATGVSSWNTHNRFTLGTRSDSLNTASNYRIGNFTLYNRELSLSEIQQNYNTIKNRFGL